MHPLITIGAVFALATNAIAQDSVVGAARSDASSATGRPSVQVGEPAATSTRRIYEDFAALAGASYRIRGQATSRSDGIASDERDSLPALVALSGIGFGDAARAADRWVTAAVIVPDEAREDPPGKTGADPRATAMPDPGTVQVFGLGLVILAMVAGSLRREPAGGR